MTIKDKIKLVLEQKPEMRSSDSKLLLYYWRRQGLELTPEQERIFIDKCTSSESITRARRIVQEENPDLQATEEIQETRQQKAVDYRYNAEAHLAKVPEYYTDENGREYITFKENN